VACTLTESHSDWIGYSSLCTPSEQPISQIASPSGVSRPRSSTSDQPAMSIKAEHEADTEGEVSSWFSKILLLKARVLLPNLQGHLLWFVCFFQHTSTGVILLSACHRNQRREHLWDEHARRLELLHQLRVEGPEPAAHALCAAELIFILYYTLDISFVAMTFFRATCELPDGVLT